MFVTKPSFARFAILLLILGWSAGWCRPAKAASGMVYRPSGDGLKMVIDTTWGEGFGYRPVRITATRTDTSPADRTIMVEVLIRPRHRYQGFHLRVTQEIEIPAGSGPVRTTLSVPHYSAWTVCQVNVLENGELLEKLSGLSQGWNRQDDLLAEFREGLPVVLVVGDKPPDTSRLVAPFPVEISQIYASQVTAIQRSVTPGTSVPQLPTALSRAPAELPERWIDYSSLDVVCISLAQLAQLKQARDEAFEALVRWTAAGGNLWVYGVGWDWRRLDRLEELVEFPGGEEAGDTETRGWNPPIERLYGERQLRGAWTNSSATVEDGFAGQFQVASPAAGRGKPTERQGGPGNPHFMQREYGMGLILAMAADDPFPGTLAEWRCVLNSVGPQRLLWSQRHGVSMMRPNGEYWKFLIPGVGLAPVTEFLVLITAFMLAIGPVNYWLLRRWRRLYLLVVTIPAAAAAVTFLLFAYAILADGLGTRVRVRSVTRIDQSRQQAVCWARLSYYSGLAPRRGLTFSQDVVVLPLLEMPSDEYSDPPLRRELTWEEDQRLRSGWLNSRTPTQYLTVRSRPTNRGLQLFRSPVTDKLQVKNRLGTHVDQLAVCAEDGQFYWVRDVDADETVTLQPAAPEDVRRRLRSLSADNRPELSDEVAGRYRRGILDVSYRRRRYYGGIKTLQLAQPSQLTGRMEQALEALDRSTAASAPLMTPGSYIAIVKQSPEVELGTAAANEEASFHVILGNW